MNIFDVLIVQPILNLLLFIYSIIPGNDFGISIIIFAIIMRFLLWPLLKKNLHQTRLMQKLQPELKKIKKQAKGNKQLEGMQMIALYKKHNISMFRSLGLMLIQLPIFIGLFNVIRITAEHKDKIESFTYEFMKGLKPIQDIINNPENFSPHFFGLDLSHRALMEGAIVPALIVMAVMAAGLQYLLIRQTQPNNQKDSRKIRDIMREAAEGKEPDQSEINSAMMKKMIKFLPIMMLVATMYFPGALVLYYLISNTVQYLQQEYLLKKDETELEEIADQPDKTTKKKKAKPGKKATAKARAKAAKDAKITKVKAKG